MGPHTRILAVLGALSLGLALGCSADSGDDVGSGEANHTEVEHLALDNVFLEHAHPAYWEPGDPSYHFPVAARVFYGFRPFEGVEIKLSDTCNGNVDLQTEGEGYDAIITLWCSPDGDDSKAFAFTTGSRSYGQEEQAFDVILGTSFDFIESVTLERIDAHHYVLDVQLPPADAQ